MRDTQDNIFFFYLDHQKETILNRESEQHFLSGSGTECGGIVDLEIKAKMGVGSTEKSWRRRTSKSIFVKRVPCIGNVERVRNQRIEKMVLNTINADLTS